MIKKIIPILFLSFSAVLFAQEDSQRNQSVELPSFVITGKDAVSLPTIKKLPSGFISTVSEEYFKPAFTPDDFEVTSLPDPGKRDFKNLDSVTYINGSIVAALGVNYRPFAKGNISTQFDEGILRIDALGFNKRAYVENSDRYYFAGGVGVTFFITDKSPFLSNAKLNADARYSFDSYKLFAMKDPTTKRRLENGSVNIGFNNPSSNAVSYDFDFYSTNSRITDEKFREDVYGVKGFAQIPIKSVNLNVKYDALSQNLSNSIFSNHKLSMYNVRPYIGVNLTKTFKIRAGFNFAYSDSSTNGDLFAAASIPLGYGVNLYGEYAPQTVLQSYYDLSKENRFFNTKAISSAILQKKNMFSVYFKYEYERYYEINGGFEYYSTDKHAYFSDVTDTGLFSTNYSEATSKKLFVNFLFHKGPYGYFYGDISFNEVKADNTNQLPFIPKLNLNLNYGYDLGEGFEAEAKLKYNNFSYSDITNNNKVDQYIDLSVKGIFNYSPSFSFFGEINNLLNSKNYTWKRYQEDTFNLIIGFNYNL